MSTTGVETAIDIQPFQVEIPQEQLEELRRRIVATRWPKELVEDRSQGAQLATLRELARYWETDYDWRKAEAKLNALPLERPVIAVPTITIGSDFDGAAADGSAYADRFLGDYSHRVLDGIGHNVPQEAPGAFANAVLEVGGAA